MRGAEGVRGQGEMRTSDRYKALQDKGGGYKTRGAVGPESGKMTTHSKVRPLFLPTLSRHYPVRAWITAQEREWEAGMRAVERRGGDDAEST